MNFTTYEFLPSDRGGTDVMHTACGSYLVEIAERESSENLSLSEAMGAATRHNANCPAIVRV